MRRTIITGMSSRSTAPGQRPPFHDARVWTARATRRAGRAAAARPDIIALVVLVLVPVAIIATALHHRGEGWGDDFALYLRQAKSLIDGNVGQVIADNHANVELAAKPGFSPYVYPWSFPVLLAPFVRLWGLDVDRLKLVEVGCWCGFLACWFGLLRRRMPSWLAVSTTAATGYSLVYLRHTDALLSELPYMFALAFTLWYADRARRSAPSWDAIDRRRLVLLGIAMMVVFNVRREGLAIVPAVMAMQAVDAWRRRERRPNWRALATPHVIFVISVVAVQLMLPSALAPEYEGSGLGQTWRKLRGPFQDSFVNQLGFDHLDRAALVAIGIVVLAGVLVRMWRHAADDVGILVVAAVSTVIVGMIPADSTRYTMAITPLVAYFGIQALAALPRSRAIGGGVVAACLLLASVVDTPSAVRDARKFDRNGGVLSGPTQATSEEMFAAVRQYTHLDDLVAFYKARALTLYTDRRAVQSKELSLILERADWFVMGRSGTIGIPILSDAEARAVGLTEVWSNSAWILWRVPDLADAKLPS